MIFKKGDIVARKSYGKDIIFYIKKIIKNSNSEVAILCGLFERIEADSSVDDLELLDHNFVKKMFSVFFFTHNNCPAWSAQSFVSGGGNNIKNRHWIFCFPSSN